MASKPISPDTTEYGCLVYLRTELLSKGKKLGAGGYGKVWSATYPGFGRVAWKVARKVKRDAASQAKYDLSIKKEISALALMRHSHIVRIYGFTPQPMLGMVMELADNKSVSWLLDEVQTKMIDLPLSVAVRIIHQVASGMQYLHYGHPISLLHLDLNARNVLLMNDFTAKIAGFGVSEWRKYKDNKTGELEKCADYVVRWGTATHVPPELWEDKKVLPSKAYDVYAYAIFIWEVLSGKDPSDEFTEFPSIAKQVISGKRPGIECLRKDRPEELEQLMIECWDDVYTKRPTFLDIVARTTPTLNEQYSRTIENDVYLLSARLHSSPKQSESYGKAPVAEASLKTCDKDELHIRARKRKQQELVKVMYNSHHVASMLFSWEVLGASEYIDAIQSKTSHQRNETILNRVLACDSDETMTIAFLSALELSEQRNLVNQRFVPAMSEEAKKLDKLKAELEKRERQGNRISFDREQKDLHQLQQSLDEKEKSVKHFQEDSEKQKKDLQEKETIQQRQHKEQMLQLQTEREELNKQQKQSFGEEDSRQLIWWKMVLEDSNSEAICEALRRLDFINDRAVTKVKEQPTTQLKMWALLNSLADCPRDPFELLQELKTARQPEILPQEFNCSKYCDSPHEAPAATRQKASEQHLTEQTGAEQINSSSCNEITEVQQHFIELKESFSNTEEDELFRGLIDESGGVLTSTLKGVTLRVPEGAVQTEKVFSVKILINGEAQGCYSRVYKCGPSGVNFLKPVELTVPHCASHGAKLSAAVRLCGSQTSFEFSDSEVKIQADKATFLLKHFSDVTLAIECFVGCQRHWWLFSRKRSPIFIFGFLNYVTRKARIYYTHMHDGLREGILNREVTADENIASSVCLVFIFCPENGTLVLEEYPQLNCFQELTSSKISEEQTGSCDIQLDPSTECIRVHQELGESQFLLFPTAACTRTVNCADPSKEADRVEAVPPLEDGSAAISKAKNELMPGNMQCSADFSGTDELHKCCICNSLLHEPVQLDCLHNCCHRCLDASCRRQVAFGQGFTCPACENMTKMIAVATQNYFIETRMKISAMRSGSSQCRTCVQDGKLDSAAEFWCIQCSSCLCAYCLGWHNKVTSGHRVVGLEDVGSLSVSSLMPTRCAVHKQLIAVHCFTCRLPKCHLCADTCSAAKHDTQLVEHERTQRQLQTVARAVSDAHTNLGAKLSGLLGKVQNCMPAVQKHRRAGLKALMERKRPLVAAIVQGFDGSTDDVHEAINSALTKSHRMVEMFRKLESSLLFALNYCDMCQRTAGNCCILLQKHRLERRLRRHEVWSDETTTAWSIRMEEFTWTIGSKLPLTADVATAAWVGRAACSTAQQAPLKFRLLPPAVSAGSFKLNFDCYDMAVTSDGHLLLAALEHGLKEYSDSGKELSCWTPQKRSNGKQDTVWAVREAADGRAVVGVFYEKLVLLLHRRATGDGWEVDRRVAVLETPPRRLSVHTDLLAVTESRKGRSGYDEGWKEGSWLCLLRLSSGETLSTQRRPYGIQCVAVTATALVTTSDGRVKLSSGSELEVVEGHSHRGELLWRHEMRSEEGGVGVCAAPSASIVYVAVKGNRKGDRRSDCVRALKADSGTKVRDVVTNSSHGLQLPLFLSLSAGQRTVLAAVSSAAIVTLYAAESS